MLQSNIKNLRKQDWQRFTVIQTQIMFFFCLFFATQQLLAQSNVGIQNFYRKTFIQADGGKTILAAQNDKTTWVVEKISNSSDVRIKNVSTGGYLNAETDAKTPGVGAIQPGWLSAMWILEPVAGTELVRIKNKWRGSYLHTETGAIEMGTIQPSWWSAQWQLIGGSTSPAGSFSMVFASDSQWAWTNRTDDDDKTETKAEQESVGTTLNQNHVKSMNALVDAVGNVKGVIINGDLTAYGQSDEFDKFKTIYSALKVPMYNGLGNHDYANNVDAAYENNNSNRMVEYMIEHIKSNGSTNSDYKVSSAYEFPNVETTITGSLAYSWDIGKVHFVQLNNFPIYQREWSNYVSIGAAKRKTVKITSALNWLERDLAQARGAGKIIILNYHDSDEHWKEFGGSNPGGLITQFTTMLSTYKVGAVFVGHYHKMLGAQLNYSSRGVSYGSTPLFYCGSASQSKYLLVNFNGNKMTVENVSSIDGGSTRTNKQEFTLFDQPLTIAPPKADGYVTFFNEAGYVARYTLSYFVNGQPKTFETGNLALGNKRRFDIPGNATNVVVKGEGQTGLAWEPWRDTFVQIFADGPPNKCFKSYGTTLNQQWDNNCE